MMSQRLEIALANEARLHSNGRVCKVGNVTVLHESLDGVNVVVKGKDSSPGAEVPLVEVWHENGLSFVWVMRWKDRFAVHALRTGKPNLDVRQITDPENRVQASSSPASYTQLLQTGTPLSWPSDIKPYVHVMGNDEKLLLIVPTGYDSNTSVVDVLTGVQGGLVFSWPKDKQAKVIRSRHAPATDLLW